MTQVFGSSNLDRFISRLALRMLVNVRLDVPLTLIHLAGGLQQQRRETASCIVDSSIRLVSALRSFVVDLLGLYSSAASSIPIRLKPEIGCPCLFIFLKLLSNTIVSYSVHDQNALVLFTLLSGEDLPV